MPTGPKRVIWDNKQTICLRLNTWCSVTLQELPYLNGSVQYDHWVAVYRQSSTNQSKASTFFTELSRPVSLVWPLGSCAGFHCVHFALSKTRLWKLGPAPRPDIKSREILKGAGPMIQTKPWVLLLLKFLWILPHGAEQDQAAPVGATADVQR